MVDIKKDRILQLTIEALKNIMCNTNMISCKSISVECDAHVSIDLLQGVTCTNCNNVVAVVDYGRDLDGDDRVLKASTLAIYINNILNNSGVDSNHFIKVIPYEDFKNGFERQGQYNKLYCFKCVVYVGDRVDYINQMYACMK